MSRRRLPAVAFIVVAIAYVFLGHLDWWPGSGVWGRPRGFAITRPWLTGGDEPFYLLMVNSLLEDHNLELDDEYESVRKGGKQAGNNIAGFDIEGHSILVNRKTGKHIKCFVKCTPQEIAFVGEPRDAHFKVSAHPAAYPALMALMALPFRPKPEDVDPLVGTFSIAIAFVGVALTYLAARRGGLSQRAALAAMLVVGFASPWLVYMRSYFSEQSIGVCFLLGFIAMRRERPVRAGISIGVAMAMKPVFVLVGIGWILERVWAGRMRTAAILTLTIGISGVVLLAINMLTIHVPLATGAIPVAWAHNLDALWDTFFEREHGLFVFAPWTIAAFAWGLHASRRAHAADVREGVLTIEARRQIMLPVLLCVAVFASLAFGPSWCWGPRYYVPFFPLLAILVADWASAERGRATRILFALTVAVSAVIATTSAPAYHWIFGQEPFMVVRGHIPR